MKLTDINNLFTVARLYIIDTANTPPEIPMCRLRTSHPRKAVR